MVFWVRFFITISLLFDGWELLILRWIFGLLGLIRLQLFMKLHLLHLVNLFSFKNLTTKPHLQSVHQQPFRAWLVELLGHFFEERVHVKLDVVVLDNEVLLLHFQPKNSHYKPLLKSYVSFALLPSPACYITRLSNSLISSSIFLALSCAALSLLASDLLASSSSSVLLRVRPPMTL